MSNRKLTAEQKSEIVLLSAREGMPNYKIAPMFGVTPRTIGMVVNEAKELIDQSTKDKIMFELEKANGNSIGDQAWRMKQYERDLIKLDQFHSPDAINARTKILDSVGKQLGQIAPVQHNIKAEVSHIIGIDMQRAITGSVPAVIDAEVVEEITDGS